MDFKEMQSEHLKNISRDLKKIRKELLKRQREHDLDKTIDPVVSKAYNEHFSTLKKIEFGTEEYKEYENKYFKEAHEIHAKKRHHFYSSKNKLNDINLIDVLEAIIDISQSSKQYGQGEYIKSFRNKGIYDYDLEELIINTIKFLDEEE